MENKQKIYRHDIIEYKDGSKELLYSIKWESDEVFVREATKEDLAWHNKLDKEEFVYGLF